MTLEHLFFLKEILLWQASFCFQCIHQIKNVNSHLIILDACLKVPHILRLHDCLNLVYKKNCCLKFHVFKKEEKKKKSAWKLFTSSFQSIKLKRQKEAFFSENIHKLNKKCIFLCSPLIFVFTSGLAINHTAAIFFCSPRWRHGLAGLQLFKIFFFFQELHQCFFLCLSISLKNTHCYWKWTRIKMFAT